MTTLPARPGFALKAFALLFLALAGLDGLRAAEPGARVLAGVQLRGLVRTQAELVERELGLSLGRPLEPAELESGLQRLRNTQLFSRVVSETVERLDGKLEVVVTLDERWTLLPIAKFSSGGGTRNTVLGVYDINTGGKWREWGGQVEELGGVPSAVLWHRDPRFLGRRLKLMADAWWATRNRVLHDMETGQSRGGFTQERLKLNVGVRREWREWLSVGAGLEYDADRISDQLLGDRFKDENRSLGSMPKGEWRHLFLRLTADLGRLDHDGYLLKGLLVEGVFECSHPGLASDSGLSRLEWTGRAFWILPGSVNFGLRVQSGYVDSELPVFRFYPGGLEGVRGFWDGQFNGMGYGLLNAELRIPSLRSRWLVLQHVLFYDGGVVAREWSGLSGADAFRFQSVGLGLRFLSPKVYRLNARLDWAWAQPGGGPALAFGIQQFF